MFGMIFFTLTSFIGAVYFSKLFGNSNQNMIIMFVPGALVSIWCFSCVLHYKDLYLMEDD